MMHVKTYWNMFRTQIDDHIFRKKLATDKRYILRKISLKFQNSKSNISWKIEFYKCYKLELFGVKRSIELKHKWLNKIVCFNFFKDQNYTQNCLRKHYNKYSYQICLWLVEYHHHLQTNFLQRNFILTVHW